MAGNDPPSAIFGPLCLVSEYRPRRSHDTPLVSITLPSFKGKSPPESKRQGPLLSANVSGTFLSRGRRRQPSAQCYKNKSTDSVPRVNLDLCLFVLPFFFFFTSVPTLVSHFRTSHLVRFFFCFLFFFFTSTPHCLVQIAPSVLIIEQTAG